MSGRAEVEAVLVEVRALQAAGGGVLLWTSGAGQGKTRAALAALWPVLRREGWRCTYHGPSRDVRDEAADVAGGVGLDVVRVPGVGEAGATWARGGCVDPGGVERALRAHPGGAADHCRACPARATCPVHTARRAAYGAPPETLRASTVAAWALTPPDDTPGPRLTILDESVMGQALREHGLDVAALAALRLDGVDAGALVAAQALAASGELGKGGRVRAGWALQDVAGALGVGVGDLVRVDPKTSTYRAGEAWARGDEGAVDPGPWQALAALREHARAGTLGGLRVAHGRLWVGGARPVPQVRAGEVVLCLDATGSLDVARVLWPAARLVEVYGAPLHRPDVVRLDVAGGVERGGTREGRARSLAGRAATLAGRLVDELGDAVGWAPRRDLRDVEHPLHVEGHDVGAWEHHGSSRSRGSNAWARKTRAVVLPHHVPQHSLDALAGALARLDPGGQDVARVEVDEAGQVRREVVRAGGLDAAGWRREARAQLVDAQTYQEAHRVRGLREPGRQVVLVGGAVPRWLRREAGAVRDVEAWGVWAVQGGGLAHVDGAREALLRAAVDAHGGAWCAQVHPMTVGEARAVLWATLPPVLRALPPAPCDLDALPLAQALGQDWARRYVQEGGLVVRQVRGPAGLVGVACDETCAALDEGALQARLWPAWAARRQDVGGALRRAVEALQGRALTWAALCEVAGGSRPTWRRRLVEAGLPPVLDEAAAVVGGAQTPQTPQNLTEKLNRCGGVQVLARAPFSCEEPMRAPEHLDTSAARPPDGASEQATPAREVACPEDTPTPARVPEVWRPVDVWRLQDALDVHSQAAHALRRMRAVPGPWAVGQVARAVGLCHVLRAGA